MMNRHSYPFASKHGMWLEEFGIEDVHIQLPDYMKEFLEMCPNIKKININLYRNFDVFFNGFESLKKLEVIKGLRLTRDDREDWPRLDVLVRKYSTSLKAIEISFIEMLFNDIKTCFAHISRFESLESLELKIELCMDFITEEQITECLKLLANKCTKFKELRINIDAICSN